MEESWLSSCQWAKLEEYMKKARRNISCNTTCFPRNRALPDWWNNNWYWCKSSIHCNRASCNPEQFLYNNVVVVFKKSTFSKGKKPSGAHLETIFSNRYYYRGFNLHANALSHWFLDDFSAIVAISFRGIACRFWNSPIWRVHLRTRNKRSCIVVFYFVLCSNHLYGCSNSHR